MTAPVLASQTDLENQSDSAVIAVPSGTVDGDLLVTFISSARDGIFPVTPPSGWTGVISQEWGNDGPITLVYIREASSEPSNYTWNFNSSENFTATMLRITGWSGSTGDIDSYVKATKETQYATLAAGSLTGLAADSLLIGWVSCEVGDQLFSPPSGWTEFYDSGQTRDNPDRVWSTGAYLAYAAGGDSPYAQFENTADPTQDNGVVLLSVAPAASSGVTGTGAGTASAQTASGVGSRTVTGTGTAASASQTATGSGVRTVVGTGAGIASAQTASGVASAPITGTGSGTATAQTASGVGFRSVSGSGSGEAAAHTSTGVGLRVISGSGGGTAAAQTSTGLGVRGVTGAGAGVATAQTGYGESLAVTGSGGGTASPQEASGSAVRGIVGSGSGSVAAQTATGIGLRSVTGTGAGVASAQTGSGVYIQEIIDPAPERTVTIDADSRVQVMDADSRTLVMDYQRRIVAA